MRWRPSSEALLPKGLCPAHSPVAASPHLPLRLLLGMGGGVGGESQVTHPGGPCGSCGQGHPSSRVLSCKAAARQSGRPRYLLCPALRLLGRTWLLVCPRTCPPGRWEGLGRGSGRATHSYWSFCVSALPRRTALPVRAAPVVPGAAPAMPGFACAEHVTLRCRAWHAWHARAAVAAAAGWSAGSRGVPRALVLGTGSGARGRGADQWDFCMVRARSTWPQPRLICHFLPWPCPWPPPTLPARGACRPATPALSSWSPLFRRPSPRDLMVSPPAPPPALLSPAPHALSEAELTHHCGGGTGWALCWQPWAWASGLMGTDWGNRGWRTWRPREEGALSPPQLGPQGEACISWASSQRLPPCSPRCGQPSERPWS